MPMDNIWDHYAESANIDALIARETAQMGLEPWPVLPDPHALHPVCPPLNMELLPPVPRRMAQAVAASTGTPVELAALCALGVSSACAVGRLKLQINASWQEPAQLFLLGLAPPGTGKSPVFRHMCSPLYALQQADNEARRAEIAKRNAERDMLQAEIAKARKSGDREAAIRKAVELSEKPELFPIHRVIGGDATPERLVELMAQNGGAIAQLDDEGQMLDMAAGQYSDMPNLTPWLKGYSGGQPIETQRKLGAYQVEDASLSLLVLTQPAHAETVLLNARVASKGFLARMLVVDIAPLPPDSISASLPPIPQQVQQDYANAVTRMWGIAPLRLSMTAEAAAVWEDWLTQARKDLWGGPWDALREKEFKLLALPARLACNLALWEGNVFELDAPLMAQAVSLSLWFVNCLKARFDPPVPLTEGALDVLAYLKRQKKPRLEKRALLSNLRSRAKLAGKTAANRREMLDELTAVGYLREDATDPQKFYQVNPMLLQNVKEEKQ